MALPDDGQDDVRADDVSIALTVLRVRLNETHDATFYCRPLLRSEVLRLQRIVTAYARLVAATTKGR